MSQYVARATQTRYEGSNVIQCEVYEVPSLWLRTFRWESGPFLWQEVMYAVWNDAPALMLVLFFKNKLRAILGVHCITGEIETYFKGEYDACPDKITYTGAFVNGEELFIPCLKHVCIFDLQRRVFNESPFNLQCDYNIGPSINPGYVVMRVNNRMSAGRTEERKDSQDSFGDSSEDDLPISYLVLYDAAGIELSSTKLKDYQVHGDVIIPVSDSEVLMFGGKLKDGRQTLPCSSIVLADLNSPSFNVIGDFPKIPGSVVSWARNGDSIYCLWNINRISMINLREKIVKIVFDPIVFSYIKGFLYWLHYKQLPLKRMHIKYITGLLMPEEKVVMYAHIARALTYL
mmetsp:Transcript_31898/g.54946  ORF Transcript_31898/g.54946 Transcript_31898/m.54946 type:complete len:345 (-) Transcript_31898:1992-3026(-)